MTLQRSDIESALSTMKGAYWEINFTTGSETLSKWYLASLGHDPQKFKKLTDFHKIVNKDDYRGLSEAWNEYRRNNYKGEFDCTFYYITRKKTKIETWARGRVVEFDPQGKPLRFVGIQLNISKIRKINKDLQRITKIIYKQSSEIKDFSSITSHNLRGPMSNLVTLIDFYAKSTDDADRSEIFTMIKTASSKLAGIIDDLGSILNITAVPDMKQERIKFSDCWKKTTSLLNADVKLLQMKISTSFKATGMFYSRAYIESIMLNLLSNCIKYRDNDRILEVEIETWKSDEKTWMSFKDNGIGIDLKKYGSKMFKYGKTFHVHPEARGIGLFITKMQIESMGGHIEVESELGNWTKFTMSFYG